MRPYLSPHIALYLKWSSLYFSDLENTGWVWFSKWHEYCFCRNPWSKFLRPNFRREFSQNPSYPPDLQSLITKILLCQSSFLKSLAPFFKHALKWIFLKFGATKMEHPNFGIFSRGPKWARNELKIGNFSEYRATYAWLHWRLAGQHFFAH